MIKATIQNSPYCMEMRFPCSETELAKELGELHINTEKQINAGAFEPWSAEVKKVRIMDINGELWFVGKDICALFGDKNHKRSLISLRTGRTQIMHRPNR